MKSFIERNYRLLVAVGCWMALSLSAIYCGLNIYSDSDDIKLGQQMDAQIRKDPRQYPIMQNHPEVKQYVMEVGNKVLSSPAITKRGIYAYKYEIIHDDT